MSINFVARKLAKFAGITPCALPPCAYKPLQAVNQRDTRAGVLLLLAAAKLLIISVTPARGMLKSVVKGV